MYDHGQVEKQNSTMPRGPKEGIEKCHRLASARGMLMPSRTLVILLFYDHNAAGFETRVKVITHRLSGKSRDQARVKLLIPSVRWQ
jgi:hypothetical protein